MTRAKRTTGSRRAPARGRQPTKRVKDGPLVVAKVDRKRKTITYEVGKWIDVPPPGQPTKRDKLLDVLDEWSALESEFPVQHAHVTWHDGVSCDTCKRDPDTTTSVTGPVTLLWDGDKR